MHFLLSTQPSVDMEIYTECTDLQLNSRLDPTDVVHSSQHAAVAYNEDDVKSVDMEIYMTDELVKDIANSVKGDFGCFHQDLFLVRFYKLTMSEEDLQVMLTSQVAPQMDRNKRSRAIHYLSILQLRGEISLDNWRPGNNRKEKQKLKEKEKEK